MTQKRTDISVELQRARALSEADNALPKEAEARYRGPDALGMGVVRGTMYGTIGWFAGNALGNLGSKPRIIDGQPNPNYRSFKARNIGAMFAFVGGIMGLYGATKLARDYRMQVDELQDLVGKMHTKIGALQTELKAQIKARNGESVAALPYVNPEWEKPAEEKEAAEAKAAEAKPATQVQADSSHHQAVMDEPEIAQHAAR